RKVCVGGVSYQTAVRRSPSVDPAICGSATFEPDGEASTGCDQDAPPSDELAVRAATLPCASSAGQATVNFMASGDAVTSGDQLAPHGPMPWGVDQVWPWLRLKDEVTRFGFAPPSPSTHVATMREPSVEVRAFGHWTSSPAVDRVRGADQFRPASVEVAA